MWYVQSTNVMGVRGWATEMMSMVRPLRGLTEVKNMS